MHRVVVSRCPAVVAFDLSIPAQVFGHRDARDRYTFTVCAEAAGTGADDDRVFGPGRGRAGGAYRGRHGRRARLHADGRSATRGPCTRCEAAARGAADQLGLRRCVRAGGGRPPRWPRATTHWQHAAELGRRFPGFRIDPDVLYVDEGQVLTSAGVAAGIDLCIHMVEADHGVAASTAVARRMVAAAHRSGGQAQFIQRELPTGGPGLAATCAWAIAEMQRPLTVADLAAHAHFSTRTLTRRSSRRSAWHRSAG